MWNRLRQAIRLRQVVAGFSGLTLGLLINSLYSLMQDSGPWLTVLLLIVFVASLGAIVYLDVSGPKRISLNLRPVKTLRTDAEKQEAARRGLVIFVSLYRPQPGCAVPSKEAKDWQKAALRGDYVYLDLPNSNLAPAIQAIATHARHLEHCWLISTTSSDPDFPGSNTYLSVLKAYLREVQQVKCEFHDGPGLELSLDDDALVFTRTLDRMRHALQMANDLGLQDDDVIADFTGGVRGMTLGMILSCLDGDRDIQMIGTHYSPSGAPTPPLFPVIFSFEPVIHDK